MATAYFITHPDIVIEPQVPVPQWRLSPRGIARTHAALARPWIQTVRTIHASTERKAIDTAAILAAGLGLGFATHPDLGENDRAATGYLPRAEFERMADRFFAEPTCSARGWERAVDAQRRIVNAVHALPRSDGDLAIVSHGAVGALLLCALKGVAISRDEDQPAGHGGHFYAFDPDSRKLLHGWAPIDP